MIRIDPADIAVLQSLRDALMACNAAHTQDFAYQSGGAYGEVSDTFLHVATKLIGDADARHLLDLAIECGENIEYCLDQMYPERKCYVALYAPSGTNAQAQVECVFADVNDAYGWVNDGDPGVRWTKAVDYVPANKPSTEVDELPEEIKTNLKMLASDMSRMFSDLGYAAHGLDVDGNDILSALPAFLVAVRAHSSNS